MDIGKKTLRMLAEDLAEGLDSSEGGVNVDFIDPLAIPQIAERVLELLQAVKERAMAEVVAGQRITK